MILQNDDNDDCNVGFGVEFVFWRVNGLSMRSAESYQPLPLAFSRRLSLLLLGRWLLLLPSSSLPSLYHCHYHLARSVVGDDRTIYSDEFSARARGNRMVLVCCWEHIGSHSQTILRSHITRYCSPTDSLSSQKIDSLD